MAFGRPCPSYVPTTNTGVGWTSVCAPNDRFIPGAELMPAVRAIQPPISRARSPGTYPLSDTGGGVRKAGASVLYGGEPWDTAERWFPWNSAAAQAFEPALFLHAVPLHRSAALRVLLLLENLHRWFVFFARCFPDPRQGRGCRTLPAMVGPARCIRTLHDRPEPGWFPGLRPATATRLRQPQRRGFKE